jgi:hypothetical protein
VPLAWSGFDEGIDLIASLVAEEMECGSESVVKARLEEYIGRHMGKCFFSPSPCLFV